MTSDTHPMPRRRCRKSLTAAATAVVILTAVWLMLNRSLGDKQVDTPEALIERAQNGVKKPGSAFLAAPLILLTVARARAAASSSGKPRSA